LNALIASPSGFVSKNSLLIARSDGDFIGR